MMATKIKAKGGKKAEGKKRTKPRIEDTESSGNKVTKPAKHRKSQLPEVAGLASLVDGELMISAQMSELVPVAQYANVTIGPVVVGWKFGGADMSILADVEWDEDGNAELTPEQEAVYWRVRGAIQSTMKVIEHAIAEDREMVERSVRKQNEREAEEQKKAKKK
jgi:hypothetical protein